MGMDREDREWFDTKFGAVHEKINDKTEKLNESINLVNTKLDVHIATPCKDVVDHVEKKHNPARTLGILGSLAGLGAAAWEGLKALIGAAKGSH